MKDKMCGDCEYVEVLKFVPLDNCNKINSLIKKQNKACKHFKEKE